MKTSLKGLRKSFSHKRYKDPRRAVVMRNGYGPNWPAQKRKALERDGHKCTKCGGVRGIAVHHIRKIAWWVDSVTRTIDYEKANDLSNLTTLCSRCHKCADRHDNPRKRNFVYLQ